MPNISSRTKENLSKTIGTDLDDIRTFDLDEEIRFIESQNNKKIEYDNETYIVIRGNAHLGTNQVTTLAEVRKALKRIRYAK